MAKKSFKKNPAEMFISEAGQEADLEEKEQESFSVPKGYRLEKEYKTERMQLLVRPTTKEAIRRLAKAQGNMSMNDLINQILDEYVERNENE